jgi:hypothetical protein
MVAISVSHASQAAPLRVGLLQPKRLPLRLARRAASEAAGTRQHEDRTLVQRHVVVEPAGV